MPRCSEARPALLAILVAAALTSPSLARADVVGPPLAAPHVGTPLPAPPPPLVGGQPGETITRTWQRCRRYGSLVIADAPRALWHLDEQGPVAHDARGSADGQYARFAHALVADGPLHEVDISSHFDGVGDAVAVPSAPDLFSGTKPYTVELWVRPNAIDSGYRYLFSRETTTPAGRQGTGVWIQSRGIGFERYRDGVNAGVTVSTGLDPTVWSHVVASYDGTYMRLFVNGVQVGARATTTPLLAAGTLELGAGADGSSGFLFGDLDEVALYDRALTRSHVAAHVAAAMTTPCQIIAGAEGASYTPTVADLGDTLWVMTIANRTTSPTGNVASISESSSLVDDAGQLVKPTILTPAAGATVGGTQQLTATVAGLPIDRVEFLVDGVVRYAKEEPPFQYAWYTNAEPNGSHTLSVRAYGPRSTTAATATAKVSVSNSTVYPTPLPFGKESLYAEFNEGDAATANNLLDNVWPARGFALPKLGWPLTWTEDPYNDAFWRFYHYGLRPEASLLFEWETTGDTRYRDKLVAILRSFAAYDAIRPVNTLTFDNNHAAAYRAMTLLNYYFKLQAAGALPEDLRVSLEAAFAKLGAFLAVPAHFEGGVNHGFNEGAALLLIADNFPAMPGASAWRTTALTRLQGMLDSTLDSDGVEVENSPFYHVYVLGLVYQIAQWAGLYEPALAPSYTQAAQRMLRYAAYVTQPSGYLPMLGATATTYMPAQDPTVYGPMASADPEFQFAYTRGAQGTPPPDGTFLFPSSGLFLMRSPLGSPSNLAQQSFVTFDAGPYRTEHSDLDALGITMYSNGSTVLPESGLFTYTDQPDRSYFHGTRAHNTVVVDGADQAAGAATPGTYGTVGGSTWAKGTSTLYTGVTHRRGVVVLRQGLSLVVDRLTGSATHSYTQTWHLPPDATPDAEGQDVAVTNGAGKRILTIRQADPAAETLATIKGQTSPVMQGWYSSSYGSKVPAWALEYTRKASSANFTTLLAAGPYASQTSTVMTTLVSGGTRVDVCVGGATGYAVTVPTADATPITVTGGACAPAPVPTGAPDPARPAYPAPDPLALSTADQTNFAPLPVSAGQIPVILFHSICPTSGCTSYNMTPTEFARTMLMLERAGYRSISIDAYNRFMRSQAVSLPPQPILITFDDARYDGWRGADAILAALGERATVFDITGPTDERDSRFLRWDELARVQASGRWDVEPHAGQGHVTISTGVDSTGADVLKPFYAWRDYDPVRFPSGNHLESYEAWKARAEDDMAQADALLRTHVPGYRPLAFAVPFGDYGQFHNNDARIPVELQTHLKAKFGVYFVQPRDDPPFSTAGKEPWRYTVRTATTADDLYAWLKLRSGG